MAASPVFVDHVGTAATGTPWARGRRGCGRSGSAGAYPAYGSSPRWRSPPNRAPRSDCSGRTAPASRACCDCWPGWPGPTRGGVLLDDAALGTLPRRGLARRIAVVTQQAATDVEMSALEVVLLGRIPYRPRLAGTATADLALARHALAEAGLAGFEQRRWSSLSGGERQRVDLARALVQEPDLLLLDEPTNHLDIRHQLELLHFLAESATTVVVTLHDLNLAAQYCDRLVLLHAGRVVAAGTPGEVLTADRIAEVYQVRAEVNTAADGRPRIRYRWPGAGTGGR
ncbi:ABC transporter ATP-binding protein [Plantactinospora sp. KLBMP9567]|nr:ABC transporter ATP-binding protein [Plantactinospora sp. KLBMP9567]MDW5324183.1 ABC transporter ATP-binding protein [Plantactinospora sp. KLBMP9567]